MQTFQHTSVLMDEAMTLLDPQRGGVYVDGTLGGGGHAAAVLARAPQSSHLLGIELDPAAIAAADAVLAPYAPRYQIVRGNYADMAGICRRAGVDGVAGILLDIGVSSHQLDTPERGFSFKFPAALDMRLDPDAPVDAAHIVNTYSEVDLADVIFRYGEERASRRIAKLIVAQRKSATITTTTELADLVAHALGGKRGKIHPATRTFQALRIAVNGELDVLTTVIPAALELLAPGGRLVIISFHSLEDRIVKHAFRDVCTQSMVRRYRLLTKHPLTASDAELAANPRSRSAKMRAIEYVG
ncbi:MAG: 16S rRNA (cytosine(1402)-N(4))-methyltransferase RsmH [Chloroflexi bacterium]|nr:MAG: 16S rRNA (cytosine(1402)-N(4))-methyltransferase RsmH [Chloroflexota bacterium]